MINFFYHIEIIKSCDISVEKFFEIIKQKSQEEDSEAKIFVTIMLSVSEYTNFVEMMRAYKREHQWIDKRLKDR